MRQTPPGGRTHPHFTCGTMPLVLPALLLLRRHQRLAPVFAPQLHAQHALHLTQDHVVRDSTTSLVVSHDLRLLADFLVAIDRGRVEIRYL